MGFNASSLCRAEDRAMEESCVRDCVAPVHLADNKSHFHE